MAKKYNTVFTESISDYVLLVTLDRPQQANALNTEMATELLDLWSSLYQNPVKLRSIVLTGKGNRVFCAGADLKERKTMSNDTWEKQHRLFEQMILAMVNCPIPIIAAVNGAAFAGGLEIALACDFIYASDKSRFAFTEVSIGIMPGAGGTQNLPRAVGIRRAKEIILTGKPFDGQQALSWGLVNQLFPLEDLIFQSIEAAQSISENAPIATRQAKKSIDASSWSDFKTGYDFEVALYNKLIGTHDQLEGVASFNEKRKPRFIGS